MASHSNTVAVGLEIAPGLIFQTFGLGHMYAGRWSTGLAIMVTYWVLQAINAALTMVWIGLITGPLTWLAFMVFAPTNVLDSSAKR